jgi:ABC-2 type transport system permease protein
MSAPDPAVSDARSRVSPLRVFMALLSRDARVTRRELPSFLVRTTLQPILFTTVFGFLLPHMGMVQGFYTSSLLPGILAISLSLASLQAVALPMVTDFGFTGEIEDRLLAPVPIELVAHEKMVAGIAQGVLAALFVLPLARVIMGPVPGLTLVHLGSVLVVAVLGAAAFSAIGLVLGTAIPPQQIGLMFSAIIAPMMFFGCAYYPWSGLDRVPAMKYAVLVNPLVYVSEGLRGTLTPDMPHMRLVYSLSALALIGAALWALGIRTFVRRAMK